MKKTILATILMAMAGTAVAGGTGGGGGGGGSTKETYTPGSGVTDRKTVPTTFIYDVDDDRANRHFIKNEFDFTLSSNVIVSIDEDETDARYMTVAAGNTQGRNIYVGHSNGGSVNACGDPLTSEKAKETDAIKTRLGEVYDPTDENGCGED